MDGRRVLLRARVVPRRGYLHFALPDAGVVVFVAGGFGSSRETVWTLARRPRSFV
jgi:hypothetical protein